MRGERTYRAVRLFVAVCALVTTGGEAAGYYGVRMGPLSQLNHGVKGEVYAVDSRTLHLRGFYYDGQAPDAFFYAGSTPRPSDAGFIIPDEKGGKKPLGRYSNQDVTITLPEGKTLKDITWFSIWCRAFAVDFGHVIVDKNLNYPRPQKIDSLPTLEHGVTSDRIVVVDAQTFLIPNFSYDGAAPDAYFWVGKGSNPGPSGILVPDENGSEEPLKRYSGKTIVITLPGDLTVFDIDFLGVWCRAFHANFGHVRIPKSLNVPPSLKMLGVAPQSSGYSYQSPSGRPAFSTPKTVYQKPTTFRPVYSTTPRPSFRTATVKSASLSAHESPSLFTSQRPYSPPAITPRPYFPRPVTSSPVQITTTRRPYVPAPTTLGHFKVSTTPRPFHKSPTTPRRPYEPLVTTRRPFYRPSNSETAAQFPGPAAHFQRQTTDDLGSPTASRASFDVVSSGFGDPRDSGGLNFTPALANPFSPSIHSSQSKGITPKSHFSDPGTSSAAAAHFGVSSHSFGQSGSPPEDLPLSIGASSANHRFGSSVASSRKASGPRPPAISSFSFSNGGSSTSFNIYG